MQLTAFRIENYRCILDSGWIDLSDIAVVVGKNESGKTSLLKALWKFNPYHDVGYDLKREWPRGRRRGMADDSVVATVRFRFTPAEITALQAIHESSQGITGVEIKRTYGGQYLYTYMIDGVVADLEATPLPRVMDQVHRWLPTFIFMDDYKMFKGTAQLDEVKRRKDSHHQTPEDETLVQIMEMAGLDLEQEVRKGNEEDREQRILDLNDASQRLTSLIADRWSQKRYEVMFQADGQHFITFVKDADDCVLVPLEERSRGFQWFFSFDLMLMHETKGRFENAILLLDEPGLHLHPAAQRDLLRRLKVYAASNPLLYTTHLPFMIEFTRLDNLYVAEELGPEGVKVHQNWATADLEARFTLQAALGLSWSQSLLAGQYTLVVDGLSDFWTLTAVSAMLREAGQDGLDEQLVLTPAGSASQVAHLGTLLRSQHLNVAVLLDSDPEGAGAGEQLVHRWMWDARQVLRVADLLGVKEPRTLEDLFDETYYLGHVNAAYQTELAGRPLTLSADRTQPIVNRIGEALRAKGVDRFNRNRPAKRIMSDLGRKKLSDLPRDTVDRFKKVIAALNTLVRDWKRNGPTR